MNPNSSDFGRIGETTPPARASELDVQQFTTSLLRLNSVPFSVFLLNFSCFRFLGDDFRFFPPLFGFLSGVFHCIFSSHGHLPSRRRKESLCRPDSGEPYTTCESFLEAQSPPTRRQRKALSLLSSVAFHLKFVFFFSSLSGAPPPYLSKLRSFRFLNGSAIRTLLSVSFRFSCGVFGLRLTLCSAPSFGLRFGLRSSLHSSLRFASLFIRQIASSPFFLLSMLESLCLPRIKVDFKSIDARQPPPPLPLPVERHAEKGDSIFYWPFASDTKRSSAHQKKIFRTRWRNKCGSAAFGKHGAGEWGKEHRLGRQTPR